MNRQRRQIMIYGGGLIAALGLAPVARSAAIETVEMQGTARGERVRFAPGGLWVAPGTTVRFVNRDPGNSHTTTAYHPNIFDRQRRIPKSAAPWDSDFLLPGESFEIMLTKPGVYDYYCLPHEMAGMVGRIVVGLRDSAGWEGAAKDQGDLSPETLARFLPVDEIIAKERILGEETW